MFSIAGDATLSSINLSRVGGEDSDYTLVTLKLSVETRSDAAICAALGVESGDALEWAQFIGQSQFAERLACKPGFPKPAREGHPRWNVAEVHEWMRARRDERVVRRRAA